MQKIIETIKINITANPSNMFFNPKKTIRMADNHSKVGNSYIRTSDEMYLLRSQVVWPMSQWCVKKMMKLKIRLETEEWVYEEHELM